MRFSDVLRTAFGQIRANLLRSVFTLLGIIVSVAFLVAVVAVIQGMNSYVSENIANAMVGANAFQVRRTPINVGLVEDEAIRKMARRPRVTERDAAVVASAIPEAEAVSIQSGWPTPRADVVWEGRTLGDVLIFGVTPGYQIVQDYHFTSGRPLNDVDVTVMDFLDADFSPGGLGVFDMLCEHTFFCAIEPGDRDRYVAAAARALRSGGKLFGAFLDFDNAVLIPHLGSATVETRAAMATLAARNTVAVLDGRQPLTPVT